MEALWVRQLGSKSIYAQKDKIALPVPTKAFLQLIPDTGMPFSPKDEPIHLPISLPFCSLYSKDIARSNITKLKYHDAILHRCSGKG